MIKIERGCRVDLVDPARITEARILLGIGLEDASHPTVRTKTLEIEVGNCRRTFFVGQPSLFAWRSVGVEGQLTKTGCGVSISQAEAHRLRG